MIHVNCIVSTGAHRERVQYGFDRNNRRAWRRRVEVDAAGRMTKGVLAPGGQTWGTADLTLMGR